MRQVQQVFILRGIDQFAQTNFQLNVLL